VGSGRKHNAKYLINTARSKKILSDNDIQKMSMVKAMRNMLVHSDYESVFAREMTDAAYSGMTDDPHVQHTWFPNGSNYSLIAKTCAEVAREVAAREYET